MTLRSLRAYLCGLKQFNLCGMNSGGLFTFLKVRHKIGFEKRSENWLVSLGPPKIRGIQKKNPVKRLQPVYNSGSFAFACSQ